MASENPNFAVTVDFTGADLWDPTKGGVNDPDPGAYAGKTVKAVEYTTNEGSKSIKVTVALPNQGETDIYLGLDFSKAANVRKLKTALASIGFPVDKLTGAIKIEAKHFLGRDGKGAACYVLVKAVEGTDAQGRKKLNDKEFATREQHDAYKAMLASGNVPAARSAPATNGATGNAAPAAGVADGLDNLFPPA